MDHTTQTPPAAGKYDYRDSGLSTVESLDDAHKRIVAAAKRKRVPGFIARFLPRRFLPRLYMMKMECDGDGVRGPGCFAVGKTNGKLDGERWQGSGGWIHSHDLDFCPRCQKNGGMVSAIARGVRPRSSYPSLTNQKPTS
jgi:hypothetical protein